MESAGRFLVNKNGNYQGVAMKCKLLKLLVIVLLIMPVTTQALSDRSQKSLYVVRYALIAGGLWCAFMTGMNLPQVANDVSFENEKCSPENLPKKPEDCYLKQYWQGGNPKGFLAMFGTIAPSVDATLYIADSGFRAGYSALSLVFALLSLSDAFYLNAPDWQKAVFIVFNSLKMGAAFYGAYHYGEGDEQGAETVGESIAKIAAYNDWCRDNLNACAVMGSDVFHGKTNITWRNFAEEKRLGRQYRLMNRIGGGTVGYTLGEVIAGAMLFPIEHFLGAEAGTVGKIVEKIGPSALASQLPQLAAMPAVLLPEVQGVMGSGGIMAATNPQKVWDYLKLGLAYGRGLTAWVVWYSFPDFFVQLASPLFNPVNYNEASLAPLNNTDIVFNEHGILHHRDDPHKDEYVSLDKAVMAAEYLAEHHYITEDDIEKIQESRHNVGAGIYGRQYAMLTVGLISHAWSFPLNIRNFVTAYSESKKSFAVDIAWNLINILAIIPYDINLLGFIGTQHANGTQSVEAVIDYLKGVNRTETELMDAQKQVVGSNMLIINGAWLGGVSPRFSRLHKTLIRPVVPEAHSPEVPSPASPIPIPIPGPEEQLEMQALMPPIPQDGAVFHPLDQPSSPLVK